MREILFRAKLKGNKRHHWEEDTDGLWIVGNLLQLPDGSCQIVAPTIHYDALERFYVDPETVGQYTGLTDKNGKRIFEHDILRLTCETDDLKWVAVVKFGNPNGGYNWGFQLVKICGDGVDTDILLWVEIDDAHAEVIGNIYDNPELLRDLIARGDDK